MNGAGSTTPSRAAAIVAALVVVFAVPALVATMLVVLLTAAAGASVCSDPAWSGAAGGGPVRVPVAGRYVVTSEFGHRVHPVTGQTKAHQGLDLATVPSGGPVVAATAGVVVSARPEGSAGNTVTLEHGPGLVTRYLHLRSFTVTAGQVVAAGQQVGVEGTTGRSTGEHLHFEVRQDGRPLSPRAWLSAAGVDVDAGVAPAPAVAGQPGAAGTPPPSPSTLPGPPAPADPAAPAAGPLPVLADLPVEVAGYRGEQLVNAATIIATGQDMGPELGVDAWTVTVAVMTAMGESSLRNLDRGDTAGPDSRGLFQQRGNGAWGTYADRMDPATATRSFLTALLRVPGYRDLPPTIAAHRTQRNADPQHYARHWPAAVQVVAALTADPTLLDRLADPGAAPHCEPAAVDVAGGTGAGLGAGAGPGGAEQVLAVAASLAGIPYAWGGSTPAAFDCSGYTRYVFARVGVVIPRTAAAQQQASTPVTTLGPVTWCSSAAPPPTSGSTPASTPAAPSRCGTHRGPARSRACTTSGAAPTSPSASAVS